ncbi:hypothetical protein QAD02_020358 [Eretmocerus hayati]|uniref:Uncharacterized protein n=1 Tax=Eretmocerus hayati TaxID=131215 RepID=A0ACC2PP36_9HYME|nr:hypothetical protein QAD02_020358 [Eretmocerus hayati]
MLPLRPRPTKTTQQRAENARKQSISGSSSTTSGAPPKRGKRNGSKTEPPERSPNMSGGQGDLDGSTIAKRLRIRKRGGRTQDLNPGLSRETMQSSSDSSTPSEESEDMDESEAPLVPQKNKSFFRDLLDKNEGSNHMNHHLSDQTPRKREILIHQRKRGHSSSLHRLKFQLTLRSRIQHTMS